MQFKKLLMALKEKMRQAEMREAIRAYAFWNVDFFGKFFLSESCYLPFSSMHLDLLAKDPAKRCVEVIAAPRGHAKTTIRCFVDILHDICFGLEDYILIISETASVGDDRVRDIKNEIEGNERIREYFGDLTGQGKWAETDIVTANNIRITSKGRGKQVRGLVWRNKRPSKIILDDIESKELVRNPVQREKVWNWIQQDVMRAGRLDGTTNFRFIGTFLHQEAALPRLTEIPSYRSRIYKAVISWAKQQELWEEWKTKYTCLEDDNRTENAYEFFKMNESEMLAGVEMVWNEGFTYYQVQEAIINTGRYAVNSELQNEPHDPETQIFDIVNAKRFSVIESDGEQKISIDGKEKSLRDMRKVAFLDPALGSESGSSYPAIAALARDGKGYTYILDIWMDKVPPSRQVVQTFEMAEKWGMDAAGLETNLFKDYMRKDFEAEKVRRKQKGEYWQVGIYPVHQSKNKEDRISALEPKVSNGWLLFNKTLSNEAIRSFEQFPTAAYNDPPDAVEGAYSLLAASRKPKGKNIPQGGAGPRRRR